MRLRERPAHANLRFFNPSRIIRILQKAVDEKNERMTSQRSGLSKSACFGKEKPIFSGEAVCYIHSSLNNGKKVYVMSHYL